jgi:CRISPR/Cas system CSM-associated protein Csm3 (group 7 of RAMP superfamily)
MNNYSIKISLLSDTTFGRGDGVAGWIDTEVEHDEYGLPFLRGRALKGLLAEECANTLFSLGSSANDWTETADKLFGKGGSNFEDNSQIYVGNAVLPKDLRQAVKFAIEKKQFTADEVLKSLTTIRRQTAIEATGSPKENSLRSSRVVLRETDFVSEIEFLETPNPKMIALLAASAKSLQRIGLGRNRGRGKVAVSFLENDQDCFEKFEKILEAEETK